VQLLLAQTTGAISQDAERALAKVAAILPRDLRGRVDELSAIVRFYAADRTGASCVAGGRGKRAGRWLATTTANYEAPTNGLWKEREHVKRRPQFAA